MSVMNIPQMPFDKFCICIYDINQHNFKTYLPGSSGKKKGRPISLVLLQQMYMQLVFSDTFCDVLLNIDKCHGILILFPCLICLNVRFQAEL